MSKISVDFKLFPNGDIRHVGGDTIYSVLEFHRWLLFRSEEPDMIAEGIPSLRHSDTLIELVDHRKMNSLRFNIDEHTSKYLKHGIITQGNDILGEKPIPCNQCEGKGYNFVGDL